MSRPNHDQGDKLDARVAVLRQEVLRAKRTLAREIKKRQIPCRCQRGGYEFSQEDFEEMRTLYEKARARWLAEQSVKMGTKLIEGQGSV